MFILVCSLVLFGTIVIAVAVYLLAITGCCADRIWFQVIRTATEAPPGLPKPKRTELSTFKYKNGRETAESTPSTDCVVCLSDFEDEERVRQFPKCRHCFHAPCIDMWLYSHSDCPVCRTPISQLGSSNPASSADERSIDGTRVITISSPAFSNWSLASPSNLILF